MAKKVGGEPGFVRLPRKALDDIADLINNNQHLSAIASQSSNENIAASIAGFGARVARKLSLDPAVVLEVAMALWNLKNLQHGLNKSSSELIETITRSVQVHATDLWKREYFDKWKNTAPSVAVALDVLTNDHPLLISAKANVLAYTQHNLLVSARIIADMRPVFDTAGEKILETVLTNTIVVNFVNGINEQTRMSFALDIEDIVALRKQCERAERKAQIILNSLKDKGLNPVLLPEEEDQ